METTPSKKLADEYVQLGGRRRSKMDDNATSTRQWEDDTAEAEVFWKNHIQSLPEREREQVEKFLPSINAA